MMHLIDPPKKELNVGHSVGGIQYVASKVMHSELLSQKVASVSLFLRWPRELNALQMIFFIKHANRKSFYICHNRMLYKKIKTTQTGKRSPDEKSNAKVMLH